MGMDLLARLFDQDAVEFRNLARRELLFHAGDGLVQADRIPIGLTK